MTGPAVRGRVFAGRSGPRWRAFLGSLAIILALCAPATAQTGTGACTHNGSAMIVTQTGDRVTITYQTPRAGLRPEGVVPGTELFRGTLVTGYLTGMARIFRAGGGVIDDHVHGDFRLGQDFRLSGAAPVLAPKGCTVVNNVHDGPNANLDFRATGPAPGP